MMRRLLRAGLPLVCAACAVPEPSQLFEDAAIEVLGTGAAESRFVDAVYAADQSLHVALSDATNPELMEALLARWEEVQDDPTFDFEVIVDFDSQGADGVAALLNAEAPVTLADGGLEYFEFLLNDEVRWRSEQTLMTHAYVVVDRLSVVSATSAGHLRPGPRVVLSLRGENLIEDLLIEHNQIFGGIDATATTAFDAPAKSIADFRWLYQTAGEADLQMWFSPQERTTKRVIDAVYGARSSVWVLTNDLANEGLANALREKARFRCNGAPCFDVRVVVGNRFGDASQPLSDILLEGNAGPQVRQVPGPTQLPTLVLVDLLPDAEGFYPEAMGMILSHDLVSSARLYRNRPVITDQLIDGALFVVSDTTSNHTQLADLEALFEEQFSEGAPL